MTANEWVAGQVVVRVEAEKSRPCIENGCPDCMQIRDLNTDDSHYFIHRMAMPLKLYRLIGTT